MRPDETAPAAHGGGNGSSVLARVAEAFASATTRPSLYVALESIAATHLHADGFALYGVDVDMRRGRLEHQWGVVVTSPGRMGSNFWDSFLGEAVQQLEPHFIEDLEAHARGGRVLAQRMLESDVHATALLPLVLEGRVKGLLSLRYLEQRTFDEPTRSLLTGIAMQCALALRNADTRDELEQRAQRLTALARAQQRLTQLSREDTLPGGIAEAVEMVVPAARCEVFIRRLDSLERVVSLEHGQMTSADFAPLADVALVEATARAGVARLASHLQDGVEVVVGTTELCAPVRDGNRTAGVIRLLSPPHQAFDSHDFELIAILARHAGTAVETARLFTLQDLQRQRAEGAAEVARVALHARQLDEGASELLHVLDRFVPSIGKAIGVARGRDGLIEYVAASGTLDALRGHRPASLMGLLELSPNGNAVECTDLTPLAPASLQAGLADEWAFVLPLIARNRTLGVLIASAHRSAPLSRHHRITLERLSASLALALDALLLDEEERLARDREQLLATALTTINHPIFILDRVGVRYANPAAAREYGWSQNELMDMRFEELVVSEGARRAPEEDATTNGGAGVIEQRHRAPHDVHRRRDGSEFPAVVAISPLTSQDGELLGRVLSVRNVSQERQLEEQMRHTEKMVAVGELVAGVAHEINNPLTGISAFAQLLLEEQLTDDQHESVSLIKKETDRAKGVIHDLLLFARNTEREAGPVDINDALGQVVRLRAYPLRSGGIDVQLEFDPSAPRVSGDAQKLQQVLLNIIGNAEYAMRDRPRRVLTLATKGHGETVSISATDSGKGMPEEVRRRIFEPFFTTKPNGVGTGLGLSVSYGIVRAHGGTITVESEPDVGTTVTIVLPALSA
ncbi:MAG TPA: ATP-binding protein [Gemmatimonas sp.]|uniref:ATP-binding protein n=1 Tax=Gemmatimonas sp. TaxID=1962908 RepID=UPI002ED8298C